MAKKDTIYELLECNAMEYKDETAILYDTNSITYEKLFEDVVRKALHLQKFPGKRIALYGPASYRYIVNLFGIILAGKDVVMLDFFLPQKERCALLSKVTVDYILTSTNQYILSDNDAIIIHDADKDNVDGLEYDKQTKEGRIITFTATADENDRAVVLSTESIIFSAKCCDRYCQCNHTHRVLSQVALHNIFGLVYSLIWPLSKGACVCIGRGLRHIDADTHYYDVDILPGTPSMIGYLKSVNAFNAKLKTVIIGGAPCAFRLIENLKDRDYDVYVVYGMAECCASIGVNIDMDGSYELMSESSVRLEDNGEIVVEGKSVMEGYFDEIGYEHVESGKREFFTGDYGRFTRYGKLVVTKHNPDILLLPTGENISRKVINRELEALSGVAEAYVCIKDDKLVAVIYPVEKSMTPDKMKRKVDKYNEKKGYRWEIQQVIITNHKFPEDENGMVTDWLMSDIIEGIQI